MAHSFTHLLSHLVFSTKDRRGHIDNELKPDLFPYMGGIVRELKGSPIVVNGVADHVHLLVKVPSKICMADLMRVLKTNSSRWVHEKWAHRRNFAWQTGYGAFSVSQSKAAEVRDYILRQEEHHRSVSFKEEFVAFLERHGITYDERYLWE